MNITFKKLSCKILVLLFLCNFGSVFSQTSSDGNIQKNEVTSLENPMKSEQRPPAFDYTPEQWFNRIIELAENELPEPAVFEKELGVDLKVTESKTRKLYAANLELPLKSEENDFSYSTYQKIFFYKIETKKLLSISLPVSKNKCIKIKKFLNHVKENNWAQVVEINYYVVHGPLKTIFYVKNIFGKNGESKKHKFTFTMNSECLHWFEIKEELNEK